MNLQIINDCAGTDAGLPTAGTDSGRRYGTVQLARKKDRQADIRNMIWRKPTTPVFFGWLSVILSHF